MLQLWVQLNTTATICLHTSAFLSSFLSVVLLAEGLSDVLVSQRRSETTCKSKGICVHMARQDTNKELTGEHKLVRFILTWL